MKHVLSRLPEMKGKMRRDSVTNPPAQSINTSFGIREQICDTGELSLCNGLGCVLHLLCGACDEFT